MAKVNLYSVSKTGILMLITAALQLNAAVSSTEVPPFPANRFVPWGGLDWLTKSDALYLLYTQKTWNNLLQANFERMSYKQVTQKLGLNIANSGNWRKTQNALQQIAIDGESWDCWINHYVGNSWAELRSIHNVSWAFEDLGWSEFTWRSEDPEDYPGTEKLRYAQLTPEQQRAADRICCPQQIWDGIPLTKWQFQADGMTVVQAEFEAKYRTSAPTNKPTTAKPTPRPTIRPTLPPTTSPVAQVAAVTTDAPTDTVTDESTEYVRKTESPSDAPSATPSDGPSMQPSLKPSSAPSGVPSDEPSMQPSDVPSDEPSMQPSLRPSSAPSGVPSDGPSMQPSDVPSDEPSMQPSLRPSSAPSDVPSDGPSMQPSDVPSDGPSMQPSDVPSDGPSMEPSDVPSDGPSMQPSDVPSDGPSMQPSGVPSDGPSMEPSDAPSDAPSDGPSMEPSDAPSDGPSSQPSLRPSATPSAAPSDGPTNRPSVVPSVSPSGSPSASPTKFLDVACRTNFTLVLVTDKYPQETTWTLKSESTDSVLVKGSGYKNDFEEFEESVCISIDDCYMFEIRDKWDDGMCCDNGQGSYAGFIEQAGAGSFPIPGLSGGAFESVRNHRFCIDGDGLLVEGLGSAIGVRFHGRHGRLGGKRA